jgi:hypothetical protein
MPQGAQRAEDDVDFHMLAMGAEGRPRDEEPASFGCAGDAPCERRGRGEGRANHHHGSLVVHAHSHRKRTDSGMDRITARSDASRKALEMLGLGASDSQQLRLAHVSRLLRYRDLRFSHGLSTHEEDSIAGVREGLRTVFHENEGCERLEQSR